MAANFGKRKIFLKIANNTFFDSLWVENFNEIDLSRTVKEIEANLCFSIFAKNSKIQNGRHMWEEENFLKIAKSTFIRYPVGRKFRRNFSISHGQGDRSKFVFSIFGKSSKIQMAAIFGETKFSLKIANATLLRYPVG